MNRGFWLILMLTLLWFLASGYWYLCRIKQICPEQFTSWLTKSTVPDGFTTNDGPASFEWNSVTPILNKGFDSSMVELVSRMNPEDSLLIVGKYFEGESGLDLAIQRANEVKNNATNYVDAARIKTDGMLDEYGQPNKDQPFDAIQFQVIPAAVASVEPDTDEGTSSGTVEPSSQTQVTSDKPAVPLPQNPPAPSTNSGVSKTFNPDVPIEIAVFFKNRSVALNPSPEQSVAINNMIRQFRSASRYRIDVTGFTDESGNFDDDYFLGRKRAWAVKKLLWDGGLNPKWIFTDSKGGKIPFNSQNAGTDQNQRVEIKGYIDAM